MHFKGNGSYWSSRVNTERWFSLGPHWNITLLGCAPGCTGAAMGPGTMSWLAEFDFPSCDLLSNRGLHCCLHLHVGWLRHSGGMVRFCLWMLRAVASTRTGSSFWDHWVVYSLSELQPSWWHFPLLTNLVITIFISRLGGTTPQSLPPGNLLSLHHQTLSVTALSWLSLDFPGYHRSVPIVN